MKRHRMSEQELLDSLHRLPRQRQPARDLWPGIAQLLEARQAPRQRRWGKPALAAAVVMAFLAGVLFERQSAPVPAPTAVAAENPSQSDLVAALQASEREYQAAFRAFVPVGLDRALLDPQAIDDIEGSWTQFRQAEAALLAALHEHPGNPFLAERLLGLRARQLDFMQKMYDLDQNSRRDT